MSSGPTSVSGCILPSAFLREKCLLVDKCSKLYTRRYHLNSMDSVLNKQQNGLDWIDTINILMQQSSRHWCAIESPSWSSEVITPRSEVWWEVVLVHVKPRIKAAKTKFIKFPFTHSRPTPRSAAKAESTLSMIANHVSPVQAICEIQYCSS